MPKLLRELEDVWPSFTVGPPPPVESIVDGVRSRRRRTATRLLLVGAPIAAACAALVVLGLPGADTGEDGTSVAGERSGQEITANPSDPTPGTWVELSFDEHLARGYELVLAAKTADGWEPRYQLMATDQPEGDVSMLSYPWKDRIAVADVGASGDLGRYVFIPRDAPRGEYQLCLDSSLTTCGEITITK